MELGIWGKVAKVELPPLSSVLRDMPPNSGAPTLTVLDSGVGSEFFRRPSGADLSNWSLSAASSGKRTSLDSDEWNQFVRFDEDSPSDNRKPKLSMVEMEHKNAAGTLASMAFDRNRTGSTTVTNGPSVTANLTAQTSPMWKAVTLPSLATQSVRPELIHLSPLNIPPGSNSYQYSSHKRRRSSQELSTYSRSNPHYGYSTYTAAINTYSSGTEGREMRNPFGPPSRDVDHNDQHLTSKFRGGDLRVRTDVNHHAQQIEAMPTNDVLQAAQILSPEHRAEQAISSDTSSVVDSPVNSAASNVPEMTECAADPVCDDLQHPRKVLSHFFGRNKSETKRIPPEAWQFVCRKHYQRKRYRGGKHAGYSEIQVRMLHKQLDNFTKYMGPIRWTIQYQNRLSKGVDSYAAALGSASHGEHPRATPEVEGAYSFRSFCGPNKSTNEVHEFVDRMYPYCRKYLHDELLKVEFLPKKWGPYQS